MVIKRNILLLSFMMLLLVGIVNAATGTLADDGPIDFRYWDLDTGTVINATGAQECLIDVYPDILITDNNLFQQVTYFNRDVYNYDPSIIIKMDSANDWLRVIEDASMIDRGTEGTFTVSFVNELFGSYPVNTTGEVRLISNNCQDIIVPVKILVVDEERVNAVLGSPYTFENLFNQSLDRDSIITIALIFGLGYMFFSQPKPTTRSKKLIWRK